MSPPRMSLGRQLLLVVVAADLAWGVRGLLTIRNQFDQGNKAARFFWFNLILIPTYFWLDRRVRRKSAASGIAGADGRNPAAGPLESSDTDRSPAPLPRETSP